MRGGISKRAHRSPVTLSRALQRTLLEAIAGSERLCGCPAKPPDSRGAVQDPSPTSAQSRKRPLVDDTNSVLLPLKKARLANEDLTTNGTCAQETTTGMRQPEPRHPKQSYAFFLRDFVDSIGQPAHQGNTRSSELTFVSEWLESVVPSREQHCRSDSCLDHSDSSCTLIPRPQSAPDDMSAVNDADGFAVPPRPTSATSKRRRTSNASSVAMSDATGASSQQSLAGSLVESPLYRVLNLADNNISMRFPDEDLPEHIAHLVFEIGKPRESLVTLPDRVRRELLTLETSGLDEGNVERYFHTHMFLNPDGYDGLGRTDRQPMAKHTVPTAGSDLRISNPVPDMIYGYNRLTGFPQQLAALRSLRTEPNANSQDLLYPFFVVEFKGAGGNLWVATNQCLGGSASCVKMMERLKERLQQRGASKALSSAAFSVAMSGTEARIHVSWKQDEVYCMQKVRSFLLQDPHHYTQFHHCVDNILDWGRGARLKEIQDALDALADTAS